MSYGMAKRFNNFIVVPATGGRSTPFFERLWAGTQYPRAREIESQALGLLDARLRGHDGA
jgi:hypothetical protein